MSKWRHWLAATLACVALATPALSIAADPPQSTLVDGSVWSRSTPAERRAYLVGIGNMVTVGNLYDEKKVPGEPATFARQIARVIKSSPVTLEMAEQKISDWYRIHPDQSAKPVLAVIWLDFIKPHLADRPQ